MGAIRKLFEDGYELVKMYTDMISERTSGAGVTVDGLLIKDGGITSTGTLDLNGVADALVIDADADTTISAPTDDQIDIEIAGADDFTFTANTFTALSGSSVATDTIVETTAAAGVTVDGCLIKDGRAAALATGALFLSTERTGTGSAQNVAHGFGAAPTVAVAVFSELDAGLAGGADIAYGTHDATNVVVTVTSGLKFYVLAIK